MSFRSWEERVRDILSAIREIQSFTKGMSFDDFKEDSKTLKAVMADISILGEAARYIPKEITDAHPEIPWSQMRGIRNRIIHGYFIVDPVILWDTVQNELPSLVPDLKKLFNPSGA